MATTVATSAPPATRAILRLDFIRCLLGFWLGVYPRTDCAPSAEAGPVDPRRSLPADFDMPDRER
jgi:hypothetical protein